MWQVRWTGTQGRPQHVPVRHPLSAFLPALPVPRAPPHFRAGPSRAAGHLAGKGTGGRPGVGWLCWAGWAFQSPQLPWAGPLVLHTLSPPPRSLGAVMCGVVMATRRGQGT